MNGLRQHPRAVRVFAVVFFVFLVAWYVSGAQSDGTALAGVAFAAAIAGFDWRRRLIAQGQAGMPGFRQRSAVSKWLAAIAAALILLTTLFVVLFLLAIDDSGMAAFLPQLIAEQSAFELAVILLALVFGFLLFWIAADLGLWLGARLAGTTPRDDRGN